MKGFSLAEALSHNARRKNTNPTRLIVGSFLAVILCGTLLLMLPVSNRDGQMLDMLDAMFTATSATCVTGLVVFDTYTQFSTFGQVVILLLIQVGGLGLVTLTTFFNIAVGRRLGFKSLRLASESINLSDASQARALLQFVMKVAFVFEAIGAALLALVFVPQFGADGIFISVFISISSFCNAGFDILGRVMPGGSVIPYQSNPYVWLLFHCSSSAADWAFLSGRTFRPTTVHTTCAHTQSWFCGSPAGCSCWALRASCSWSITIRSRWGR